LLSLARVAQGSRWETAGSRRNAFSHGGGQQAAEIRDALAQAETFGPGGRRPLFKRAIYIQEHSLGPGHPDLATTVADYAVLLKKTGRRKRAIEMETRARDILSRNAGERLLELPWMCEVVRASTLVQCRSSNEKGISYQIR
jgi:hypothetical protein